MFDEIMGVGLDHRKTVGWDKRKDHCTLTFILVFEIIIFLKFPFCRKKLIFQVFGFVFWCCLHDTWWPITREKALFTIIICLGGAKFTCNVTLPKHGVKLVQPLVSS